MADALVTQEMQILTSKVGVRGGMVSLGMAYVEEEEGQDVNRLQCVDRK